MGIQGTEHAPLSRFTGKGHGSYTEKCQILGIGEVRDNRICLFFSSMAVTFSAPCSMFCFTTFRHLFIDV